MAEITFEPDWVSPPGETIEDLLEDMEWNKAEFARRMGCSPKFVNDLIKGRASISQHTAQSLARVFDMKASFWLQREADYRAGLMRRAALKELAHNKPWARKFPLSWMESQGWIKPRSHEGGYVEEMLRFFNVGSIEAWQDSIVKSAAAFRASDKFDQDKAATYAWLHMGEKLARQIDCKPYNKANFRKALYNIRALTKEEDPSVFVPQLQSICCSNGVAVVFLPYPPKCRASGATKWVTPSKAMLLLSLRYRTNDQLWFTFYHEAAHILLHKKKQVFIEGIDGLPPQAEQEANSFASKILVPEAEAVELERMCRSARLNGYNVSRTRVEQAADRIGVAPGILVGYMNHQGWLEWNQLQGLKVRYKWNDK